MQAFDMGDTVIMNSQPHPSFIDGPAARVTKFILDWHQQWAEVSSTVDFGKPEAGKERRRVDFNDWSNRVHALEAQHFLPTASSNTANSFGSEPKHDPQTELISKANTNRDVATVETSRTSVTGLTTYRVYELARDHEAGWLIAAVTGLSDPPDSPLIPTDEHKPLFAKSSVAAELKPLPIDLLPNETLLFTDGRTVVNSQSDSDIARVETAGYLHIHSGIIGIRDYGYKAYDFEPLGRRVDRGKYRVDTVSAFRRTAAARVLFNEDQQATSWRMANTNEGNGTYGVDAGNLAIFDAVSFANLTVFQKERIYSQWIHSDKTMFISMVHENDGVVVSSGYGDGVYPAYWGIDENGEIVSLVIDFLVLVKEDDGILLTV